MNLDISVGITVIPKANAAYSHCTLELHVSFLFQVDAKGKTKFL